MNIGNLFEQIGLIDDELIMRSEMSSNKTSIKKIHLRYGSLAACLMVTIISIFALVNNRQQINNTTVDTNNSSTNNQNNSNVPDWYTPGELSILTILNETLNVQNTSTSSEKLSTLFITALASETNQSSISFPDNVVIDTTVSDADFIKINSSPNYPNGLGIYYDTNKQKTICFSAMAQTTVEENGILPVGGYIYILFEDPASGNCIIDIRKSDHMPAGYYFYNIYDKKLLPFPVGVDQTPSLPMSSNKKYYAASIMESGKGVSIYLIDITGEKIKTINILNGSETKASHSDFKFSDNSKYLLYSVYDQNGNLFDNKNFQHWALYNIEKHTTIQFTGSVINFINNDTAVVLQTKDGGKVLNTDTGEDITSNVSLEHWQTYKVRITSSGNQYSGLKQSATLVPLFQDENETKPVDKVDGIFSDGEYIYSYNNGDEYVSCYSVDNGQRFQVPVDNAFLDEINSIDQSKIKLLFHMGLSPDKTKLLLFYSTDKVSDKVQKNVEFSDIEIGKLFRNANSLKDLESFVQAGKDINPGYRYDENDNPYKNMERFYIVKGNGYTSLLVISDGHSFAAVEDYRSMTFSLYVSYNDFPWNSAPKLYDGGFEDPTIGTDPYRKKLTENASQDSTIDQYSYIEQHEPYYDYADYYKEDKIDTEKAEKEIISNTDLAYSARGAYISDRIPEDTGIVFGRDILDRETLAQLMTKVASLNGFKKETMSDGGLFPDLRYPADNKGSRMYNITLSVRDENTGQSKDAYTFDIGTSKAGKKYINTDIGYLYVDDMTYNELIQLCDKIFETTIKPSI